MNAGIVSHTVGKTQARKEFFPLVDSLTSANSAIGITDHDEPVAVLLSYQNYVALTAKASVYAGTVRTATPNLMGSITVNSDLDEASTEITNVFKKAIQKSAGDL